ncbi:MAG: hypothetical protein OEY19_04475 [Gammaproteobacteria bacterium]|nr:hypothetical protein [Gammaproteobacteria bacterium]MDH5630018.1 hypothetical protein [Gammaproteobacteria bacterium]
MKEKIFKFVKSANQVLFFIAALLLIFLFLKNIIKDFFRYDYEPPKVELVDEASSESHSQPKVVYEKIYHSMLKDVYIFQIKSDAINLSNKHQMKGRGTTAEMRPSSNDYLDSQVVNMLFVKENGHKRMLLETDALITFVVKAQFDVGNQTGYLGDNNGYKFESNRYSIVSSDTDKDGFLSNEDERDLYLSDYDGANLIKVMENVSNYRVIRDNTLLITQTKDKKDEFYIYSINDEKPKKLDTAIELQDAK